MKNLKISVIILALTVVLTACGNEKMESKSESGTQASVTSENSEETTESTMEEYTENSTEALSYQTCTVDNISFSVDSNWKPMDGHEGTFYTPDRKTVYQIQGRFRQYKQNGK